MNIDIRDRKEIGKSGETVSAIGLGTWNIKNYTDALEAFLHAFELGIDNFDTAEIYDGGRAEEFIGKLLHEVGRDNIFITTKLAPASLIDTYRALKAAEASLKRMNIKTVDLILAHWTDSFLGIRNQIRALETLVDKGYTRYIGVSNYTIVDMDEAFKNLRKYEIVVNQVRYNVYDKTIEDRLLEYCVKNGVTIQAYTPLEHGRVADDERLKRIGEKYGKTAVQVALNYLIAHRRVVAIPKTERVKRVDEIYGSLGWRLSIEDINYIKEKI